MNYLAHAYLSFNDPDLLAGNMISDFIKGRKQFDYPERILAGIKLHRAIDEFTDSHAATREIKNLFRPAYRLYAGAMTDVVYDYFLANDEREFLSEEALEEFTQTTYSLLNEKTDFFPEPFAKMFPYMRSQNWLFNYRYDEGMQKSFGGVARRAKYITETSSAFEVFMGNKALVKNSYDAFFPEVKAFAAHTSARLLTT